MILKIVFDIVLKSRHLRRKMLIHSIKVKRKKLSPMPDYHFKLWKPVKNSRQDKSHQVHRCVIVPANSKTGEHIRRSFIPAARIIIVPKFLCYFRRMKIYRYIQFRSLFKYRIKPLLIEKMSLKRSIEHNPYKTQIFHASFQFLYRSPRIIYGQRSVSIQSSRMPLTSIPIAFSSSILRSTVSPGTHTTGLSYSE